MLRFKLFLFSLSLFAAFSSYAQMDFRDSSVQVIAYWDLGETYEYEMSLEKIVYNQEDTLSRELMTYDVEITVIDSTENSYTVRWFYKNFKSDSDNPVMQRIASAAEDIAVDIKTDELGIILGVENWEEVRDYMTKSFDNIREEFAASTELDRMFTQLKNVYSSKAS